MKLSSDSMNRIVQVITYGKVSLDNKIKTREGWIAGMELIHQIFVRRLMQQYKNWHPKEVLKSKDIVLNDKYI